MHCPRDSNRVSTPLLCRPPRTTEPHLWKLRYDMADFWVPEGRVMEMTLDGCLLCLTSRCGKQVILLAHANSPPSATLLMPLVQ